DPCDRRRPRPVALARHLLLRVRRAALRPARQRDGARRPLSRRSTARACASNPSRRASRATAGPSLASVRGPAAITLERLMKSYTPSGEEKRALPPVGRTWFGPAR